MKVSEVMSRKVRSTRPDATLLDAEQLMVAGNFRHLPVVRDGLVVGVLTQRDLLRHRATLPLHVVEGHCVEDAMRVEVATVDLDASLEEAAETMARERIGSLLVTGTDGALAGILTTTDVLAAQRWRAAGAGPAAVAQAVAGDVMHREPVAARRDEDLLSAARRMHRARLTVMPVIDPEGDRVLGLLTERELRLTIGDPFEAVDQRMASLADFTAEMAMTSAPMVMADAPLSRVLFHLAGESHDAVCVTDAEHRLLGVLTWLDVVDFLAPTSLR